MAKIDRRQVLAGLSVSGLAATGLASPAHAQAGPAFYPVPVEIASGIDQLAGRVTLGNLQGDAHIVEFFDYNCTFCRRTAREIRPLLLGDPGLKFTLVNFAVLSVGSIGASRVALAFSRQKPERYLDFHEAMFERHGQINHEPAIEIAVKMGADQDKLLDDADSDVVTDALKSAVRLGDALAFRATPSYLMGRDAVSGYLNLASKKIVAASLRQCERAFCT